MRVFVEEVRLWLLALHVISFVFWLAGLYYLPRLFVYHADVPVGSRRDALLQQMERRLLRIIITPAEIATWFFGLLLLVGLGWPVAGWLWMKLVLVLGLSGLKGFFGGQVRRFANGERPFGARTYRILNEVPPLLTIVIVFLAILRPF